ncbi:hypothetical protein M0R45_032645 [Rubus argutus]|uniref:Uncharacterized protein n=1 Tax=Rubus argutus TaxID=59490 RepID=A0AAW1WJW1_RUBAR
MRRRRARAEGGTPRVGGVGLSAGVDGGEDEARESVGGLGDAGGAAARSAGPAGFGEKSSNRGGLMEVQGWAWRVPR